MQNHPEQPDLIGQSQAFLDALEHASSLAPIDRPVLVVGERGSGKELFAARIHFLSQRWSGPLLKVNCAAMTDTLLDSELFGHEAGAFTGASKKHMGRFERAEGGTLFLDEIASASLQVQEKLLRVIEYGEFERVGGNETLTADVRIVAAANIDLRKAVDEAAFRADLLDRLSFDVIAAPPLRDRRDDIIVLASHFAKKLARELDTEFPGFSSQAFSKLQAHDWPGNVRELKNVTERALYRWASQGDSNQIETIEIDPFEKAFGRYLPAVETKSANEAENRAIDQDHRSNRELMRVTDLRKHLSEYEREIVIAALNATSGNQKKAAKNLNLSYDQIRGIIRKHDIDPAEL